MIIGKIGDLGGKKKGFDADGLRRREAEVTSA